MRFLLCVEGDTERKGVVRFFRRWLDTQFDPGVGLSTVRFNGCSDYIGGIAKKVAVHLNSTRGDEIIGVIGLLDYYGNPLFQDERDPEKRKLLIKRCLEEKVSSPRFRQFLAVHESEAWLLSDTRIFPHEVATSLGKIAYPERVDGIHPPAKILAEAYRRCTGRSYKKVVDGVELFEKLDPHVAGRRCPHLQEMLDEMKKMTGIHTGSGHLSGF